MFMRSNNETEKEKYCTAHKIWHILKLFTYIYIQIVRFLSKDCLINTHQLKSAWENPRLLLLFLIHWHGGSSLITRWLGLKMPCSQRIRKLHDNIMKKRQKSEWKITYFAFLGITMENYNEFYHRKLLFFLTFFMSKERVYEFYAYLNSFLLCNQTLLYF